MRAVCTIVNFDYLSQANVLFSSLKNTNKDLNYFVLVLDGKGNSQELIAGVITIYPVQLDLDSSSFQEMCEYYDVIELATSLKPFVLNYLLNLGFTSVIYLDPDIQVFSSLENVFKNTEKSGTTLTPHRLTPTRGSNPGFHELGFLRYGTYNLGFIGVTKNSTDMLDWWSRRLVRYSGKFPEEHIFTDQKWMDLARAYFDLTVIRERTLNIAPWNLDERPLHYLNGILMCPDGPVVFIHFSQLSSSLSKGIFLPYWEDTLDASREHKISLEIISGLSRSYSELLINAKNEFTDSYKSELKPLFKSSLLRKALREKYLQTDANHVFKKANQSLSLINKWPNDKILNTLERSFFFRHEVYGLGIDFKRLKTKLRKHWK